MQELLDQTWAHFTETLDSINNALKRVDEIEKKVNGFEERFIKAFKMLGAHNV